MKVLLIYELVPDETKTFVLTYPTDEEAEVLKKAAGQYMNTDSGGPEVKLVDEWVREKWRDKEVNHSAPLHGPFDMVIMCGFYL
jgi:hypothetical protein